MRECAHVKFGAKAAMKMCTVPRASVVKTLPGHNTLDFEFIFGHLAIDAFYCCQTLHALHAVMLDITWGLKKLWFREPALKAIKASVLTRYYSLPSGISGRLFSVHIEVTGSCAKRKMMLCSRALPQARDSN